MHGPAQPRPEPAQHLRAEHRPAPPRCRLGGRLPPPLKAGPGGGAAGLQHEAAGEFGACCLLCFWGAFLRLLSRCSWLCLVALELIGVNSKFVCLVVVTLILRCFAVGSSVLLFGFGFFWLAGGGLLVEQLDAWLPVASYGPGCDSGVLLSCYSWAIALRKLLLQSL